MMGEASLETSPKNNTIQDMINSDNMKLELIVQNLKYTRPKCIILTGDFNCRSDSWWVGHEVTR